ncbi:MAG: CsgG/HfaB family protein, partial [Candidatus Tectomicrobia bacterium]
MRISIRTAAMVLLLAVLPFVPNAVCDPVPRVWMLPFHNTVMNSSASSLTQTIPDLLQVFFSQSAQYAVVDRDHLEMILAERSLTWHGLVSSAQRAEIGTLLGATVMLSGSFVVQGEQVRVMAHAYEVQTSRLLASSQATGRFDDLAGLVSHI